MLQKNKKNVSRGNTEYTHTNIYLKRERKNCGHDKFKKKKRDKQSNGKRKIDR